MNKHMTEADENDRYRLIRTLCLNGVDTGGCPMPMTALGCHPTECDTFKKIEKFHSEVITELVRRVRRNCELCHGSGVMTKDVKGRPALEACPTCRNVVISALKMGAVDPSMVEPET